MPPGASSNRESKFALVADSSPPKKKKNSETFSSVNFFPELPTSNTANPKYIVSSSAENGKTISVFSTFAVYKGIQNISKEINSISELRDGNLLLLVKNTKIAEKFLNSKTLHGICPIKCKLHDSLNVTKGTIYAPYLNNIPNEEIIAELKSQGVIDIYKFTRNYDGKQIPSGLHLLSFDSYHLPGKIDISWHSAKVNEYIPNPMRCKSCQLLGHTTKWCKNSPACVNCNLPPHSPTECTRIMCANCQESHAASSRECKKYIQQKQILGIKIRNKCTIKKAKEIHNSLFPVNAISSPTSYAGVVSSTQKNQTNNNNTNDKSNIIKKNNQQEKTYTSPSNNNVDINNSNSGTTSKNITITNTNSTNNSFQNNTNLHKCYSTREEHTLKNNNSKSHSLNTVINAKPVSNDADSLTILPLNTNFTDIEFSSDAEDIQQNLHNYINSNSPSFVPLNSLNTVLQKSQHSLNRSSDSD